ncbi:MAG: hypothetical protein KVP17_001457 [Porospora cf. gigantea B]|nr:MAG: hypothetical protein KVP17_001457 [Porospora cf. gigantea B]
MFFPTPETNLEDIVQQEFTKSLEENMASTTIASFLYTLQFKCREQAFQDGVLAMDNMTCDLVDTKYADPSSNHIYPELPCQNQTFLDAVVVQGDTVDYDKRPAILEAMYDTQGVPEDSRVPKMFPLHQQFSLFAPFFNGDGDRQRGIMGPLPRLSSKLDKLAEKLDLHDPLFDEDPWDFDQSSAAARGPPTENPTNVEMNHHWDILFRCEPRMVEASFKVKTIERADTLPLYWYFTFTFTRPSQGLAVYKADLNIRASHFYHVNRTWELVAPLTTLALTCWLLLLPAGASIVQFLPNFLRILLRKGKFKRLVYRLLDPLDWRHHHVPLYEIVEENLAFFFMFLGFVVSAVSLFVPSDAFAVQGQALSPLSYWLQSDLDMQQIFTQVVFALFNSGGLHCAALTFCILRIIEFSVLFAGTNYIVLTFVFVFVPILHFMTVFMLILFAFALLAHVTYGNIFSQYATLWKSVRAMLLYSFGFGDFVGITEGINAQIEGQAYGLMLVHLAFTILLVVIMLNIFTSIVVDAYQVALDRCTSKSKLLRLEAAIWYRMKVTFGYYDDLQDEIDILGGRPGPIMFRSILPRDSPLGVTAFEPEPNAATLIGKLKEAVEALDRVEPQIRLIEEHEVSSYTAHSESVRLREEEGSNEESARLLAV